MERYGTTFNFRLIWEDVMLTYDPDNIKVHLDALRGNSR